MKLNNVVVIDIEVDGIDIKDYPDFCDAYISEAKFRDTKEPLNDEQLVELQEQNMDKFNELVIDEFLSIGDMHYG
jgi:hypothetical protein|tara:strand:- start:5915 stop:6139 length:225 start_codon:yes stop_codon:yes gene_type:complete